MAQVVECLLCKHKALSLNPKKVSTKKGENKTLEEEIKVGKQDSEKLVN
jgi:hypothetical protein